MSLVLLANALIQFRITCIGNGAAPPTIRTRPHRQTSHIRLMSSRRSLTGTSTGHFLDSIKLKNTTNYHTRFRDKPQFPGCWKSHLKPLASQKSQFGAVACFCAFLVSPFLLITPVHIRQPCPVFCLIDPTLLNLI